MNEVTNTSTGGSAPDDVKKFAEKMSKAHGTRVVLAREASGYHLYLPCPECLDTHGRRELADPKYAINVSKYLGIGDAFKDLSRKSVTTCDPTSMMEAMRAESTREMNSGICMRTRQSKAPHRYSISQLMSMTTVRERHPDIMTKAEVAGQAGSADGESHWELDEGSGKLVPPPPGLVVPINSLPADHPAVTYLLSRGYCLDKLWDQFRCSFCYEEYPHGTNGIFYRKFPGRWKDTSQNRVVFYSLVKGVPITWQARYPEKISDNGLTKMMLHPYYGEPDDSPSGPYSRKPFVWDKVATRSNAGGAWIPMPPFDETAADGTLKFLPSKYRTAKYSTRQLMGWDSAVKRANEDVDPIKWVVLCEGPLDAARVGPGGVALIGSSISVDNAEKVASNFHIVFTAFDEDKAGKGATDKVGKMLLGSKCRAPLVQLVIPLPIPSGKDIGDMRQEVFDDMLYKSIKRSKRGV